MIRKIFINNKGFSVVEALITIFAFSVALIVIGGIFIQSVNLQRRASAIQEIQENAMLIFEAIAREIRVSEVFFQDDNSCTLATLNIRHPINGNISYTLNNGNVTKITSNTIEFLNSDKVEFTKLVFCINGSSLGDNNPSRITIISSIKSKSRYSPSPINLQTTVTSRNIVN